MTIDDLIQHLGNNFDQELRVKIVGKDGRLVPLETWHLLVQDDSDREHFGVEWLQIEAWDDKTCTCTEVCSDACKGGCGCEKCRDDYNEYLSSRFEE